MLNYRKSATYRTSAAYRVPLVPPGNQVAIAFVGAYTPPTGNLVAIPFGYSNPIAGPDSYSTPYNITLTVAAPGVLANDILNWASAALASTTTHGALTFNPDGSFVYIPTSGYDGPDSFSYTLTNGSGSSTATVSITVLPLPPPPIYLYDTVGLPYGRSAGRHRLLAVGWGLAPRLRTAPLVPWQHAPAVARSFGVPWAKVPRVAADTRLAWTSAPVLRTAPLALPWQHPPRVVAAALLPWAMPPFLQHNVGLAWRAPPEHQIAALLLPPAGGDHHYRKSAPYRRSDPYRAPTWFLQCSAALPWLYAPKHERRWWLPWRHAPLVPWRVHSPGVLPPPIVPPGGYVPPLGNLVAIAFACPQLVFLGNQAPVPFGPAACYFAWPQPRVYIVQNSASVVRLPERTPIAVESITLAQSVDDAHWSMAMSLADPADLEWLKATAGGPKVVEITINGYVWTAIVEAYSQDRAHPKRTVSVSGRSQSALLDAPYAALRSKIETADKLAEQLIDDEIAGLAIDPDLRPAGFSADYSAVAAQTGTGGWTVTGGAFGYQAQPAIAVVRTIAAASGAVVQAHPWDVVLIIAPRFAVSPWAWVDAAPDKQIQDDIILHDSLHLVSKPLFDYVLVSGAQVGVSDPIIRTGESGDTRAPMVVDALMTEHAATRERGRNVLSDRGEQARVDIVIPLFPADVAGQPGLILPLQLVQVIEPTSWKALALGTHIAASMQNVNGVGVLVVEQTITVERHYSDAD
jgi:hypothetical protein